MTKLHQIKLITMRQFLFLNWLYHRKKSKIYCDLSNINIDCFNCLDKKGECINGIMPASYFYKKIHRQYFDCKRVLDSLKIQGLIEEINLEAKDFHLFYLITEKGIEYYEKFEVYYGLTCRFNHNHKKEVKY